MASLKNHPGMWLRDDAARALNALEDKYGVIRINSAGRTIAEQNDLIRRFDRGEPGIFMPARPPETSSHVRNGGEAIDAFNYTSDRHKLEEFGFEWFGPNDRVHYTFRGWAPPAPASSAAPAATPHPPTPQEYPEMFYAVIKATGAWFLVVPQGTGKPRGIILGANAVKGGDLPVLEFEWDASVAALKAAVDGI
jgi:hypothetical protein